MWPSCRRAALVVRDATTGATWSELGIRYFGVKMAANPKVNCAGGQVRHRRSGADCLESRINFNLGKRKKLQVVLIAPNILNFTCLVSAFFIPHTLEAVCQQGKGEFHTSSVRYVGRLLSFGENHIANNKRLHDDVCFQAVLSPPNLPTTVYICTKSLASAIRRVRLCFSPYLFGAAGHTAV